jgi:hypothetical protein
VRTALSVVVTAAALTAAAGCGSEHRLSKAEYEQTVRSAYAPVQAAFLGTRVGLGALPERVAAAQDRLRQAADRLEEAKPPKEVERQNEEIVEGLRTYVGDLGELAAAARRGDPAAIEAFTARISDNEAVKRIAEAAEEMKFKGYDLGRIAAGG